MDPRMKDVNSINTHMWYKNNTTSNSFLWIGCSWVVLRVMLLAYSSSLLAVSVWKSWFTSWTMEGPWRIWAVKCWIYTYRRYTFQTENMNMIGVSIWWLHWIHKRDHRGDSMQHERQSCQDGKQVYGTSSLQNSFSTRSTITSSINWRKWNALYHNHSVMYISNRDDTVKHEI